MSRFSRQYTNGNAIGGTCDQDLLVVHGTAIQGSGHARMICSSIFDCWRGNGIRFSMLSTARHENSPRPCAIKISGRKPGNECRTIPTDTKKRGPSSRVLQEVIRQTPLEYVTVGWLTSTLHRDSFGIAMLCLGLLATTPVGSTVPGLILAVMAVQLIVGRGKPVFPHIILTRPFPPRQLLPPSGQPFYRLKYFAQARQPVQPVTL